MTTPTIPYRQLAIAAAFAVGGCVATSPKPHPRLSEGQIFPAVDWFQHQMSVAKHARAARLAAGDKLGARKAYAAIMVPACERVKSSGPAKYRARCDALLHPAKAPQTRIAPVEDATCDLDRDDSKDTPEQITACSD